MKTDLEKTKALLLEAMSTTEQLKDIRKLIVEALVLTDIELKNIADNERAKE